VVGVNKYQHLFKEYNLMEGLIDINSDFEKIKEKVIFNST